MIEFKLGDIIKPLNKQLQPNGKVSIVINKQFKPKDWKNIGRKHQSLINLLIHKDNDEGYILYNLDSCDYEWWSNKQLKNWEKVL
ncbi:MAG: hypothetical protein ACW98D_18530 [Promethearchaeota archaeon]|jgi:hypothetical protein